MFRSVGKVWKYTVQYCIYGTVNALKLHSIYYLVEKVE
jgi:hypothetical protein